MHGFGGEIKKSNKGVILKKKMSLTPAIFISDYRTATFNFDDSGKRYTLFETLRSREWMDGKTEDPLLLYMTIANKHNIVPDTQTFIELINGKQPDDAYEHRIVKLVDEWKNSNGPDNERSRANIYYQLLSTKRKNVPIMFPFYIDRSYRQKAVQIYDLQDLWSHKPIKRLFFMLAFKFLNSTECRIPLDSRVVRGKYKDYDFIVYEQAADALWDYIESVQSFEKVSKFKKLKTEEHLVREKSMKRMWLGWLEERRDRYKDFLDNQEKYEHKIYVFSHFLWLYLKHDDDRDAELMVVTTNNKSPH